MPIVPIIIAVGSVLLWSQPCYRMPVMIKSYHHMSLVLGLPGIVFQFAGIYLFIATGNNRAEVLILIGLWLLLAGLAYYSKAKAHGAWWCLLGLFSLVGLIILALLPDDSFDDGNR
jgi:hypothetical protein